MKGSRVLVMGIKWKDFGASVKNAWEIKEGGCSSNLEVFDAKSCFLQSLECYASKQKLQVIFGTRGMVGME